MGKQGKVRSNNIIKKGRNKDRLTKLFQVGGPAKTRGVNEENNGKGSTKAGKTGVS